MGNYPLVLAARYDCSMFYNIVKTGFIIEFNDIAEIVRYNTTTAVRRAMCCAVASARDIGRRRDQAEGAELTPRDPGCRHQAVVFQSSGRSLLSVCRSTVQ